MDNTIRINNIIYRLRKAKGMTQKELAEKLHTTSKAISNWERGKNSVPAEMISKIAKELGVDKEFLYDSYEAALPHNENLKFFYCPECKNVLWSFSKSTISCCNHKLEPLMASVENTNHYMYTSKTNKSLFTATTSHPQDSNHHIEFVAYVTGEDVYTSKCIENVPVNVSIPRAPGGKLYMFCSKHGLFCDDIF